MWDRRFFHFNVRKSSHNGALKSGILPPSIIQESRVPQFYKDAIIQCGAENDKKLPDTNEVIELLWRSGLPEAVLNAIWNSIGVSSSGQLSRQEFYSCLVLIALAQKKMTIADLTTLPSLPIPHLSTVKRSKSMILKQFKKDSALSKPNGHLLKTVHPLFTESNVKLNGDLISFDSLDTQEPVAEDGYVSLSSLKLEDKSPKSSPVQRKNLSPVWDRIVDVASSLFTPLKQTNAKMLDAFYTEKGHSYLLSLLSIQQILRRIAKSCHSQSNIDPNLISRCDILIGTYDNLVDLLDIERISLQEPLEMETTDYRCNICGQKLSVNNTHFDLETELSYHINCANFWLNKVDSHLPN